MNSRNLLSLLPFTLPITFLIPYALFVERFRVLLWVWRSAYFPFWFTFGVIIFGAIVTALLLYHFLPGALTMYATTLFFVIAQPSYLAMREHRHFLLVVLFLLLCGQAYIFEHLRKVLEEPYYAARRGWWEVYPKAIPHLRAVLYEDGEKTKFRELRLSNFGKSGCFVFSEDGPIRFAPKAIAIKSADKVLLERSVALAMRTKDGFGLGLRFCVDPQAADSSKDLEDYLGYLRRAGYVEV